MGKYTLLIVLAAIVGGSMLTLNQRRGAHLTGQTRAEGQAGLLARQIAESGQGVALASAVTDGGFMSDAAFFSAFGTDPKAYNGGFYQADSFRSYDSGRRLDLTVSGTYGSASPVRHVITSSYEFDPMDYPGPIWLDVPYATASGGGSTTVDGEATIAGVNVTLNAHLDLTKYNELNGLLPQSTMTSSLEGAVGGATMQYSNGLKNTNKDPMLGGGKLLDDLNVDNAEDLYQAAIGEINASDRVISPAGGTHVVSSSVNWTGPTTITHVNGSLAVTSGGRVNGEGVLAVSGNLVVNTGGQLEWDGLVIVRSDQDSMRVTFDGNSRIDGGLVVTQEAYPQVGHMDVTVNYDPTGAWSPIYGLTNPYGFWANNGNMTAFPFYSHSHKFDHAPNIIQADGSRRIRFMDPTAPSQAMIDTLAFKEALNALGSSDVQLRFANTDRHGHGYYRLRVDGDLYEGTVRGGFAETFSSGNAFTTAPFPADELESLIIDIRSLPSLRRLFETEPDGCEPPPGNTLGFFGWPTCVGHDPNREGALVLQILSGGTKVYEASTYWHVNTGAEWDDHEAALTAWRNNVVTNGSFGLKMDLSRADITIDIPNIAKLADRLRFVGNKVNLLSSTVRHVSAEEHRAAPSATASPGTTPGSGPTLLCHTDVSGTTFEINVAGASVATHLGHGDTVGACP